MYKVVSMIQGHQLPEDREGHRSKGANLQTATYDTKLFSKASEAR